MKPSAIFLVASQIINTGLKFVVFLVLTNHGGLATAGSYTLALAITTPTFLLFNIGLREIYVTTDRAGLVFQRALALRAIYGLIAIGVASGIGFVAFPSSAVLIFWMSVYRYSEALLEMVIAYFQRKDSALGMASLRVIYSIITTLSIVLCFFFTNNLILAIFFAGLSGFFLFIFAILLVRPWASGMSPMPSKMEIWSSFRDGSMLSISSFAVSLGTNIPVLFIESFHSSEQVGFYSAIYHVTTVSNILYSSIAQLELRRLAVAVHRGDYDKFQKRWNLVAGVLTGVGILGGAILALVGLPLFEFIFNQDFSPVYSALLGMGVFICLTPCGFLLDAQLVALQRYSTQGVISMVALGVTVVTAFLLVPKFAVLGGVAVILISLAFRNVTKFLVVRQEVRMRKRIDGPIISCGDYFS